VSQWEASSKPHAVLLLLIDRRGASSQPAARHLALPARAQHGAGAERASGMLRYRPAVWLRAESTLLTRMRKADPCNLLNSAVYVLCSCGVLLGMAPGP